MQKYRWNHKNQKKMQKKVNFYPKITKLLYINYLVVLKSNILIKMWEKIRKKIAIFMFFVVSMSVEFQKKATKNPQLDFFIPPLLQKLKT